MVVNQPPPPISKEGSCSGNSPKYAPAPPGCIAIPLVNAHILINISKIIFYDFIIIIIA